jgi:hypothetical protein
MHRRWEKGHQGKLTLHREPHLTGPSLGGFPLKNSSFFRGGINPQAHQLVQGKGNREELVKKAICSFLLLALIPPAGSGGEAGPASYQSPLPGAEYVLPQTSVIVRPGGSVDPSILDSPGLFEVQGSASGLHPGSVLLSDDGHTVLFKPATPFVPGELVAVRVAGRLPAKDGGLVAPWNFTFRIETARPPGIPMSERTPAEIFGFVPTSVPGRPGARERTTRADTLPLDFPTVSTSLFGETAPGRLFLGNSRFSGSFTPYLMILDNSGAPIFDRKMPGWCADFKVQPEGLLTYYDSYQGKFFAMDSSYAIVDSFACGNGYTTDLHDLRVLPNGHALLLSYDPEQVDMSQIVPGGNPQAIVTGVILQEIDRSKNVVFQWRSWDHFQITDATHEDFTAATIDAVHSNAIELDGDGNLLLSSRHLDEITKIDRQTGEIIWRWGGLHNEFTFVNDSIGFSHQHALRRIENGDYTLFDNGNFHTPPFSRALEYRLDQVAKTATLVWQYRHSPDVYGMAMGYVQRFSGGNTLIGWGAASPAVTEVAPDGSTVFELSFDEGTYSYRAYRFPWQGDSVVTAGPAPTTFSLSQNYPNPFNGTTRIVVDLPVPGRVTLKIFNILGQEVRTVLDGLYRPAGQYQQMLNLENLPSGVYFYRLSVEGRSLTRRMLLVR